jgi:hypothetical protein
MTTTRTRLLAIPPRIGAKWGMVGNAAEAAALAKAEIYEAMRELYYPACKSRSKER